MLTRLVQPAIRPVVMPVTTAQRFLCLAIPGILSAVSALDVDGITRSGGRVSVMRNRVNVSANATQPTSSAQPASGVTINGKNAIFFDNDNNRFLNSNIGSSLTNATIFVVVQQVVSGALGHIIAGTGANQTIRVASGNLGFTSNDGTTTITNSAGPSLLTTPAILALTCDAGGSSRASYLSSLTAQQTGSYDGTIGSQFFGTISSVAGNARGGYSQGESIIANRVYTKQEIALTNFILSRMWGIKLQ